MPNIEKAETSLLSYLASRHEQELLDRDRELAEADIGTFFKLSVVRKFSMFYETFEKEATLV